MDFKFSKKILGFLLDFSDFSKFPKFFFDKYFINKKGFKNWIWGVVHFHKRCMDFKFSKKILEFFLDFFGFFGGCTRILFEWTTPRLIQSNFKSIFEWSKSYTKAGPSRGPYHRRWSSLRRWVGIHCRTGTERRMLPCGSFGHRLERERRDPGRYIAAVPSTCRSGGRKCCPAVRLDPELTDRCTCRSLQLFQE